MNLGQEPLCFQVSAFNARIGPIMLISYLPRATSVRRVSNHGELHPARLASMDEAAP
jgi:hypothetical protein